MSFLLLLCYIYIVLTSSILGSLSSPLPQKLCPITSGGVLSFDDLPEGPLSTYNGFHFPGVVDWSIISGTTGSAIPYNLGITSRPNALLSLFHFETSINSGNAFTFDLVSFNLTALTASNKKKAAYLKVRVSGFRPGEPAMEKWLRVRNAFGGQGMPLYVYFGGDGWRGLQNVAVWAVEEGPVMPPAPGEMTPGFVLDDVVYNKRLVC
ncbi:hypothetical protein FN846DRAFT_889569 [Sphaerosporella brunnea]|uniref:Complex I intermediate-associated protein 30-domain-containing protein n=1 Tax=Sphaerosporella brunnea TaxID=1250544 RepID=A0A5J5EZZ5_9PEZI|nr:hypothetical protein FN846DRAFT_889569 [Sphaerosporella brunnea]